MKSINHIYTAKPCFASGLIQFVTKEGFRYMSHPLSPGKWRVMLEATAKGRGVDNKPCTVDQFRSLGMPVRGEMPTFVIPKPVELATAKVEDLPRVSEAESLGLESIIDPNQPRKALESLMMIGMAMQRDMAPEGWASTT